MSAPVPPRFQRYTTVVARAVCTALALFAATMLAGEYITDNVLTKSYLATAQIQVRPPSPLVAAAGDPNYNAVQIGLLQSSDFLLPVIERLGLRKQWSDPADGGESLSDAEALARLGQILSFEPVPGTSIVRINVKASEPHEASDIANAIADRYQNLGTDLAPAPAPAVAKAPSEAPTEAPTGPASLVLVRAEPPVTPAWPDENVAHLLTFFLAIILSINGTAFVEMILLFQRAGERDGS